MKFAKRLEKEAIEEWAEHYIPYKELKKILKKSYSPAHGQGDDGGSDDDIEEDNQRAAARQQTGDDIEAQNASLQGRTPYTEGEESTVVDDTGRATGRTRGESELQYQRRTGGDDADVIPGLNEQQTRRNREVSAKFLTRLKEAIAHVGEFVKSQRAYIEQQKQKANAYRENVHYAKSASESAENRKKVLDMESFVWQCAAKLRDFVELNYTAIYKIMKKHDKVTGIPLMDSLLGEVEKMPFMKILDPPSMDSGDAASLGIGAVLQSHNIIPEEGVEGDIYGRSSVIPSNKSPDDLLSLPSHEGNELDGMVAPLSPNDRIDADKPGEMEQESSVTKTADTSQLRIRADQVEQTSSSKEEVIREFRQQLVNAHSYVTASLRVMSPEMEDTNEENIKLERFATAAKRAYRKLNFACKKDYPMEQIRTYGLASKLELYRYMVKVIVREMELTYPEGAAALESLIHAHFDMFHMYMSSRVQKPSTKRVKLISEMLPTPQLSQMKQLFRESPHSESTPETANESDTEDHLKKQGKSMSILGRIDEESAKSSKRVPESVGSGQKNDKRDESGISQELSQDDMGADTLFSSHRSVGHGHPSQAFAEDTGVSIPEHYHSEGSSTKKREQKKLSPFSQRFWGKDPQKGSTRNDPNRLPSEQNPFQHRSLAPRRGAESTSNLFRKSTSTQSINSPAVARAVAKLLKPVYQDRAIYAADSKRMKSQTNEESADENPQPKGDMSTGRTLQQDEIPRTNAGLDFALSHLVGDSKNAGEPHKAPAGYGSDDDKDNDGSRCSCLDNCSKKCWKRNAKKILPPIFDWLGDYNVKKHLFKDLVAGITSGIVAIPQGLSRALLAGVPPVYGIYSSMTPALVYIFFGTSKHAAVAPMSIPALMVATAVESFNPTPTGSEYIRLVMVLTMLVGIFSGLLGLLRFGFVVNFISRPVLKGFTSASAIIAMLSVFSDVFGTSIPKTDGIHNTVAEIAKAIPDIHVPTFVLSVIAFLGMMLYKRTKVSKKLPGALVTVVVFIIVMVIWFEIDGTSTAEKSNDMGIEVIGDIPSALPAPEIPSFSSKELVTLIPSAITISFVAYLEHVAVAKTWSVKFGYETEASQELRAVGICNVVGSFFQSFPAMGAFSQSAINVQAGARSQIALMFAGLWVMVLLVAITPALFFLPRAVLAILVVTSVLGLIDIHSAKRLWREDKRDFFIMMLSLLLTLFLGVQFGVLAAMGASLVFFIYVSAHARIAELGRVPGTVVYRHVGLVGVVPVRNVKIMKFYAPLYFANVGTLKDALSAELTKRRRAPPKFKWKALVLSLAAVPSVDSTAIQVFEEIVEYYHKEGVPIVLSSPNSGVETALAKSGVVDLLGGPLFVYRRVHEAVRAVLMNAISLPEHARKEAEKEEKSSASENNHLEKCLKYISRRALQRRGRAMSVPQNATSCRSRSSTGTSRRESQDGKSSPRGDTGVTGTTLPTSTAITDVAPGIPNTETKESTGGEQTTASAAQQSRTTT
eukprot:gb/GECG01015447.1/.p1 GENE.gb/GECG01015447.1/~~gb/GECG01015447.1/.p1  ORF type:complete len:1499 (+),score=224.51 gb/GECG01015447.1/:1-4497(+)